MLPFLKKSQEASVAVPESVTRDSDSEESFDSLEVAAEDILSAIQSKSAKELAAAIRAAFELCNSEPYEEGEMNG